MAARTAKGQKSESNYTLPNDSSWTDACSGSVGSKPNLDDIQKQIQENQGAFRENRKALALAIHCGFCGGYHLDMQPAVEILIGGEVNNDYNNTTPDPVADPPIDSELVTTATEALHNPQNVEVEEDDETEDDELTKILGGGDDDSNKSSSDS